MMPTQKIEHEALQSWFLISFFSCWCYFNFSGSLESGSQIHRCTAVTYLGTACEQWWASYCKKNRESPRKNMDAISAYLPGPYSGIQSRYQIHQRTIYHIWTMTSLILFKKMIMLIRGSIFSPFLGWGECQCCGSGKFMPDPGFEFFPSWIPDPGQKDHGFRSA